MLEKKIVTLDELAKIVEKKQKSGKRVVHCHGVFDLLHIGHIRHFEEARELGDLLVVTLTPDCYVNKGPHRPAFSEPSRLEAVAAINFVDYVALNKWSTAVETIEFLRPDFYVKGNEFKDGKDITGALAIERDAVEGCGGQMAFTGGDIFSSSFLINRFFPQHDRDTTEFLSEFRDRHNIDKIINLLKKHRNQKVLVLGETIVDEYCYCEALGKTGKEPILAANLQSSEYFAGGVVAVANHVASFRNHVTLCSFLGDRYSHRDFVESRIAKNITSKFYKLKDAPTILKKRFVDSFSLQKLFEVCDMDDRDLSGFEEMNLCNFLEKELDKHDVVIVTDYGHGMFTEKVRDLLCKKAKFLAVNTQVNSANRGFNVISKYKRADYVCLTLKEFRMNCRDRYRKAEKMLEEVTEELGCTAAMLTQGKYGNVCYKKGYDISIVPAFAYRVKDRVGAGDAVFSTTSLAAALGAEPEILGFLGNVTGAEAVMTVCNREPVKPISLFRHITSLLK